jgi:hypothetical protein
MPEPRAPVWPDSWDPPSTAFDLQVREGISAYWAAIHKCGAAYRERIARDLARLPDDASGPDGITLVPFDLEPSAMGPADAWLASMPTARPSRARIRLPAGTPLRRIGWTGDWPGSFEVLAWCLVNGPLQGRDILHAPAGARFASMRYLVPGLIVDPGEAILGDPARADRLVRDLMGMARGVADQHGVA